MASPPLPSNPAPLNFDVDKLSYEIFSILESKFLFGYDDPKLFLSSSSPHTPSHSPSPLTTPRRASSPSGKVCILSIDGGGRASDGLLAGAAIAKLESSLRTRSGDPSARIADFFDVLAGSGAGGVLACMLSARSSNGRPLFSAEEALGFLVKNLKKSWSKRKRGFIFKNSKRVRIFKKLFEEMTLKDTVRPVLVPCYDLTTGSPFLFSRADAVENEGYDFKIREVCEATCCDGVEGGVDVKSVDSKRKVLAVGGGVAMGNPTAAAITHVLNNKKEFPLAGGVEDLLVVSIGSGDVGGGKSNGESCEGEIVRIAAEGVADMVDQAVAMAFGHSRTNNYIRIQATGAPLGKSKVTCTNSNNSNILTDPKRVVNEVEEMLSQRNIESVLFRGKKLAEQTNAEKLEWFAHELMKEHDRRKTSAVQTVVVKTPKHPTTPRASNTSTVKSPISTTAFGNTVVGNTGGGNTAGSTPARNTTAGSSPSYSSLVGHMLTTIL